MRATSHFAKFFDSEALAERDGPQHVSESGGDCRLDVIDVQSLEEMTLAVKWVGHNAKPPKVAADVPNASFLYFAGAVWKVIFKAWDANTGRVLLPVRLVKRA